MRTSFYLVSGGQATMQVTFSGDGTAACQTTGRCGLTGTETFHYELNVSSVGLAFFFVERKSAFGAVTLTGGQTVASVTQAGVAQPCTDTLPTTLTLFGVGTHGQITFPGPPSDKALSALGSAALGDPFATRCAGPRVADVSGAIAATTYPVGHFRARHSAIDLAGTNRFQQAGFAGTVATTVHLVLSQGKKGR